MGRVRKKTSQWLLQLARQSIEYFLETKNYFPYDHHIKIPLEVREEVQQTCGTFVVLETRHSSGKPLFRGESGLFEEVEELGKLVSQLAINAAFFYPSTPRLKPYELNELVIHIFLPGKQVQFDVADPDARRKIAVGSGLMLGAQGRFVYELPFFLSPQVTFEQRLRRLRLKLGATRKGGGVPVTSYWFVGQHFSESRL